MHIHYIVRKVAIYALKQYAHTCMHAYNIHIRRYISHSAETVCVAQEKFKASSRLKE